MIIIEILNDDEAVVYYEGCEDKVLYRLATSGSDLIDEDILDEEVVTFAQFLNHLEKDCLIIDNRFNHA